MNIIKNISVFIIISLIIVPHVYIIQCFKIPSFIHHFYHHKQETTNLIEFITLHYFGDRQHSKNKEDHHRLPFHDNHQSEYCSHYSVIGILDIVNLNISEPTFVAITIKNNLNQNLYFKFILSFWQPPKLS